MSQSNNLKSNLHHYRSQVTGLTSNKFPLRQQGQRKLFKQSLVPDLLKKYNQYKKNQDSQKKTNKYVQLYSERKMTKGYEHLLSPRSKNQNKYYTSSNNYRNYSPRENIYINDHQSQLQQNRSVKFISKLRQKINSPIAKYQSPVNKDSKKQKNSQFYLIERQNNKFEESQVKQAANYQPQLINLIHKPKHPDILSQSSPQKQNQKQSFQQKLIQKCKTLQNQIQSKQSSILKLQKQLHIQQNKYQSQINLLKNQLNYQKNKKNSQKEMLAKQLEEIQKSMKNMEKSKNNKEKALMEQISKYSKQLKQSEQERNKMILEFETILKNKLEIKEQSYHDKFKQETNKIIVQNKMAKEELQMKNRKFQQLEQEKENILQENKLLNLQLKNYIKWNDQASANIRNLERKVCQVQSINKKLDKQNQAINDKVNELQPLVQKYSQKIKSLQHTHLILSQQSQILKFQTQSLKNQLQSKQKDHSKLVSILTQQKQILQTKYLLSNQEKIQLCEELEYQRKQIYSLSSLVNTLEDKLEEERRECQQNQLLKERYQVESKERMEELNRAKEEMIFKQNQINLMRKRIEQLQQQTKLIKMQKTFKTQLNLLSRAQQQLLIQQTSLQHQNSQTICLQRIQLLQSQISQLMQKFKQQKTQITKQYQKTIQQLKKKNLVLQKQNFTKQQTIIEQKRRYTLQYNKLQQRLQKVQQQLIQKNKQYKLLNEEFNVKSIQIKHLSKNLEEVSQACEKKVRMKQEEVRDMKRVMRQENQKLMHWSQMIVQNVIYEIAGAIKKNKFKDQLGFSNMELNQRETSNNMQTKIKINTNHNIQSKTSLIQHIKQNQNQPHLLPPNLTSPFVLLNQTSPLAQNQTKIRQRAKQLISSIHMLNKKLFLYQTKLTQLQHVLNSQHLKIHQQYIQKVHKLQHVVQQKQNQIQSLKAERLCTIKQEKQKYQIEVKRHKQQKNMFEEQLEEIKGKLRQQLKIKQQVEDCRERQEKEFKRIIKKLEIDVEEYKNIIEELKGEKQLERKEDGELKLEERNTNSNINRKNYDEDRVKLQGNIDQNKQSMVIKNYPNNNLSSVTTITKNPLSKPSYPQSPHNNQTIKTKTHIPPSPFNQTQHYHHTTNNPSLQQILQTQIRQLSKINQELSRQNSLINQQLIHSKQQIIQLQYIIKQLEQQIFRLNQNQNFIKREVQRYEGEYIQTNLQKEKMENSINQLVKENQRILLEANDSMMKYKEVQKQLEKSNRLLRENQSQLDSARRQLAKGQIELKKNKQQLKNKMLQCQNLKNYNDKQTKRINQTIKQIQNKWKQEQDKNKLLQKVNQQLLALLQKQVNVENVFGSIRNTKQIHKNVQYQSIKQTTEAYQQYQQQQITNITNSFNSKLQSMYHSMQQLSKVNESLKNQIQRQKSLTEEKNFDIIKKQREIELCKQKIAALQKNIQKLEIQIQQWRFICQSNNLNKSLSFDQRNNNQQNFQKYSNMPLNSFSKYSPNNRNIQYPQKGSNSKNTRQRTKSPIKQPSYTINYHSPSISSPRMNNNGNQVKLGSTKKQFTNYQTNDYKNSYQMRLKNSIDSNQSIIRFQDTPFNGNINNFDNSSGQMSFF